MKFMFSNYATVNPLTTTCGPTVTQTIKPVITKNMILMSCFNLIRQTLCNRIHSQYPKMRHSVLKSTIEWIVFHDIQLYLHLPQWLPSIVF